MLKHCLRERSTMNKSEINFKNIMRGFKIPESLKGEIVTCQKKLHQLIRIHQSLVSKSSTKNENVRIQANISLIEGEIRKVNKNQKKLTNHLNTLLQTFFGKIKKKNITIHHEIGHGYVNRLLSTHFENYVPAATKEPKRKNKALSANNAAAVSEHQNKLIKSAHAIVNVNQNSKASEVLYYNTTNNRESTSAFTSMNNYSSHLHRQTPSPKPITHHSNNSSLWNIACDSNMGANKQVSLLKPIAERNIGYTTYFKPIITTFDQIPPPIQIIKDFVNEKDTKIGVKRPDKSQCCNSVEQREITKSTISSAINKGRLNLKEALNKARTTAKTQTDTACKIVDLKDNDVLESVDNDMKNIRALAGVDNLENNPTSLSPVVSDDSSDSSKTSENRDEPEVLTKEAFLRNFGLYTHAYVDILQEKCLARRARRRRNVNSTKHKDYHYKGFDILERQYQGYANKKMNSKKPILYSPPATRAFKKRKFYDAYDSMKVELQTTSNPALNITKSSSQSNDLTIIKEKIRTCITCNKNGSTDDLSSCIFCCNFFHLRCHKHVFSSETLSHSENICPICLRKKQRVALMLKKQEKDKKNRDRLIKVNEKLHVNLAILWNKYDNIEQEIYEKHDLKRKLLKDGNVVRNNVITLLNFVDKFKNTEK